MSIATTYALRYDSLHAAGRCLSFPCDAKGSIDLDTLSERARNNYFAARATVGRDYAHPVIEQIGAGLARYVLDATQWPLRKSASWTSATC